LSCLRLSNKASLQTQRITDTLPDTRIAGVTDTSCETGKRKTKEITGKSRHTVSYCAHGRKLPPTAARNE
jgi:hypothetical protein